MRCIKLLPFRELKTDNLLLKKLSQSEAPGIFALRSNSEVIQYTGIKRYETMDEAESYIQRMDRGLDCGQSIVWSIFLASTETFIGTLCFWNISQDRTSAEIGYDLLPPFQKQGFMREAVHDVLRCGFEYMGLEQVVANLRTDNLRSVKLLEKNGFRRKNTYWIPAENEHRIEMALYVLERAAFAGVQQQVGA